VSGRARHEKYPASGEPRHGANAVELAYEGTSAWSSNLFQKCFRMISAGVRNTLGAPVTTYENPL